jgi:uncharacterized protein YjhX (UPF0386 family)
MLTGDVGKALIARRFHQEESWVNVSTEIEVIKMEGRKRTVRRWSGCPYRRHWL